MPITPTQKAAIEEVLNAITSATAPRGRRQLAGMFLDLVDRTDWPQYYEIIPEPRCINLIQQGVEKGRYKDATDVFTDLSLVFWNALFYNEAGSQIADDATTLKTLLETEWRKRTVLPTVRSSPPPSSAQNVHKAPEEELKPEPKVKAKTATPAPMTPAAPTPISLPTEDTRVSTPVAQSTTAPTTSRPQVKRPRTETPEMDVDIMSDDGPEEDFIQVIGERDAQSDEIVRQLEKGLPRWPGFGEDGWSSHLNLDKLSDIVAVIKGHKDVVGNRLAAALEAVPEESSPILHLPNPTPVSLKQIETRTRHKVYTSAQDFDKDMERMFLKARRYHEAGSDAYGKVLILQRLYQALTSLDPPSPPYATSTNFSTLKAGPGSVKPLDSYDADGVEGVTVPSVPTEGRETVEQIQYKGWTIKIGDWVHLANPDDPSRPIIGQVFRCWSSTKSDSSHRLGLTVAWYFRPEQTFHVSTKTFLVNEIFKTNHFADHPVDEVIEKVACQFTARYIQGRPRPPHWHLGFPLYICDSKYSDGSHNFVRIKNWKLCVPEEVRDSAEYVPVYPFERTVFPAKLPSPFLSKTIGKTAGKGMGGLLEDDGLLETDHSIRARSGNTAPAPVQNAMPSVPVMRGTPSYSYSQYQQPTRVAGPDRSVATAAGGLAAIGGAGHVEKLPPDTTKLFDRDPETNELLWFPAPPLNTARPAQPKYSMAYLQFLAKKRKAQCDGGAAMDVDVNADGDCDVSAKRARTAVLPTVTETLAQIMKEVLEEGRQ